MLIRSWIIFLCGMILSINSHSTERELNLLVLYPSGYSAKYGQGAELKVQSMVNWLNGALSNTGASLKAKLVHVERMDFSNKSVGSSLLSEVAGDPRVQALRSRYKPHLTISLANKTTGLCGKANFPKVKVERGETVRKRESAIFAVSTVGYDCLNINSVFAHEIGHNLGVGHGSKQGHSGEPIASSRGYGVDHKFVTIMPYPEFYGSPVELQTFSSPSTNFCKGEPCGTRLDNAASGMDQVFSRYVQYYPACFPLASGGGGRNGVDPDAVSVGASRNVVCGKHQCLRRGGGRDHNSCKVWR